MKHIKEPVVKNRIKFLGICFKRLILPTTVKITPKRKTITKNTFYGGMIVMLSVCVYSCIELYKSKIKIWFLDSGYEI